MDYIESVHAREVLDSRGNPTVEVEAHCLKAQQDAPLFHPARPRACMRRGRNGRRQKAIWRQRRVAQQWTP